MNKKQVEAVRSYLTGRRMLSTEWPFSDAVLDFCKKHEFIKMEPALTKVGAAWLCKRCGNNKKQRFYAHNCSRCKQNCFYCRHCIQMGKSSSCVQLYSWSGDPQKYKPQIESCMWEGNLSTGQQKASDALLVSLNKPTTKHLIWAVCGAGKTEVLFPAIEESIRLGWRIAIATPRTDVVKELAPRITKAFPSVQKCVLYGGNRKQNIQAQLVIATTHQLIRYYHTFDLLIVDEVDAFPFSYDPSLQYAVNQAKKETSVIFLLSATPSKSLLQERDLTLTKMASRFHGKPLPLPRFEWVGNWQKILASGKIPRSILKWIDQYKHTPRMIFVPSISLLKTLSKQLQNENVSHSAVFADATNRHEAIASFRKGRVRLLLTTTILERGVTVENVQVAVLGAESGIYTEACLVQICGRVGRKSTYPSGDIVFWHYGVTVAMKCAKKHIHTMNQEAGFYA